MLDNKAFTIMSYNATCFDLWFLISVSMSGRVRNSVPCFSSYHLYTLFDSSNAVIPVNFLKLSQKFQVLKSRSFVLYLKCLNNLKPFLTRMLQEDPVLFQLYKDLVVSQVISAEEFWANRLSVTAVDNSAVSNKQDVGISAAFLVCISLINYKL